MKYSPQQINQIRKMYIEGHSQRGIARKINMPWQSVWNFIKDIRTIDRKKLPSKFTKQLPEKALILNMAKARILAYLAADGYVGESKGKSLHIYRGVRGVTKRYRSGRKTKIAFYNKDIKLIKQFISDVRAVYNLRPRYNPRRYEVIVFSSKMYDDLLKYTSFHSKKWYVPVQILEAKKKIKREWLKAFFDCEGNVEVTNNHKRINLTSVNGNGLRQIQNLLYLVGIINYINGPYEGVYRLRISGKNNVKLFYKEIGFNSNNKHNLLERIAC